MLCRPVLRINEILILKSWLLECIANAVKSLVEDSCERELVIRMGVRPETYSFFIKLLFIHQIPKTKPKIVLVPRFFLYGKLNSCTRTRTRIITRIFWNRNIPASRLIGVWDIKKGSISIDKRKHEKLNYALVDKIPLYIKNLLC